MATVRKKIHFPLKVALPMIWNYIKTKLKEQLKAVSFIIIYLVAFKILVLQSAPKDALQVSLGVGMVVLGLAMFLEGLFLGLMPLGDRVGVQLPQKTNIYVIMFFGLLLGFGATLAEPSISTLRLAGEGVTPWATPLLYRFLELDTNSLVWAVGAGVGIAVACGMARFYYGIGLKPFIYSLVPFLLAISCYFSFDENLKYIINLAWDTGGVTTGPVTVPLVLAMGIGISKASGKKNSAAASGLGVVTLASLFPVLGVFAVALYLNSSTPKPMTEKEFFSSSYRQNAIKMLGSEEAVEAIAFQRGSFEARTAFYNDKEKYKNSILSLVDNVEKSKKILGKMSIYDWLTSKANEDEKKLISERLSEKIDERNIRKQADSSSNTTKTTEKKSTNKFQSFTKSSFLSTFVTELRLAIYAVIPLVLLLLMVLVFLLKDKLKRADESILGIFLSLIGMAVLTTGIQLGLSSLGDQIGKTLPMVYKTEVQETGRFIFKNFDTEAMVSAYNHRGQLNKYFYVIDDSNNIKAVPFDESRYDKETGNYEYIKTRDVLWTAKLSLLGITLVCLFAFGMGYGSTIAEPALNALGITIEEMTVGTVKRSKVVGTVSIGVGTGLLIGVCRLILDIPACWLLVPGYLLLLILTYYSDEEFTGLAWDSGGVTTGPITVPLVLAMGLGIGGGLNVIDGFGIVSMASLFPILTMLVFGIRIRKRQNRHLKSSEEAKNVK